MKEHDVSDQPAMEEPMVPRPWAPTPPKLGSREWLVLIFNRFGFLIVSTVTAVFLVVIYVNADLLRQNRNTWVANEQGLPEPDLPAAASMSLTVNTDPGGAAVFVDGEFVGVSPLHEVTLAEGSYLVSVQKQDYTQLDTFVTFRDASASLQFTLREADAFTLAGESEDTRPEALTALDEAGRSEPPSTEENVSSNPAIPEEPRSLTEAAPQEQTTPSPVADETPTEVDRSVGAPSPVANIEDEPVVEVGELQIDSQPKGASVSVAGREVGVTPLLIPDVQAGPQQITLRLDGYEAFSTTVRVVAQQRNTVNGQLKQLLGTLTILAKPWGNIYIDGKRHESQSRYTTTLPSGNHRVRVEHPALGRWEQVVEVSAGEERTVTVDFGQGNS